MSQLQKKRLGSAAAIVMSSIVISRLTGFLRETLVPNILGTNYIADAYNVAFRITGLMYDLLVGGAIAAALIPILTAYIAKNEEEDGWKAVGTFINVVFILMIFVCTLGIIFSPQLVPMIAVGFEKPAMDLTVKLCRILFPSVAFLMLAGLANGVLNSYHRFAAAAYGPAIYNIGSAASILLSKWFGVEAAAYGVMTSSLVYFIFQLSFAVKDLKFYKLKLYLQHPGFKRLFSLAIPSMISSSIVQVNVILTGTFASLFGAGSVTALNMADRTWQMPYGVFAQGMGIAILPMLSAKLAVSDLEEYKKILMKGLKTVLYLAIPSSFGFVVLHETIIRTLFKFSQRFDESAVSTAGSVLAFFSLALLTQSVVAILNRAFYAGNDTKTPLFVGAGTIFINFGLSYIFYRNTSLGVAGMALSYSITSAVNAVFLLWSLNRKMGRLYLDRLFIFVTKAALAALSMGLALYYINNLASFAIQSKFIQAFVLIVEVSAGAAVYFTFTLLLKMEEAMEMLQKAKNRLCILTQKFIPQKNRKM